MLKPGLFQLMSKKRLFGEIGTKVIKYLQFVTVCILSFVYVRGTSAQDAGPENINKIDSTEVSVYNAQLTNNIGTAGVGGKPDTLSDFNTTDTKIQNDIWIKWGGYITPGFISEDGGNKGYSIKYARFKTLGNLTDWLFFLVQTDFGNGRAILKDAFGDFKLNSWLKVRVGQYKYRFGVYQIPWDFPTVHKPMISSAFHGDPRDIGAAVIGKNSPFGFEAGLLNGSGRGVSNDDSSLTFTGTVFYHPRDKIEIGASLYEGSRTFESGDEEQSQIVAGARRDRWGVYIDYGKAPLLLQAEYVKGYDNIVESEGWYIILGYKVLPSLQPIIRLEDFDPDKSIKHNKIAVYAFGFNLYLSRNCIIRNIFEVKDPEFAINNEHTLTIQFGFRFDGN